MKKRGADRDEKKRGADKDEKKRSTIRLDQNSGYQKCRLKSEEKKI